MQIYSFLNNPKDLDPSFKTDLDLWNCFGRQMIRLITKEIQYTQKKLYNKTKCIVEGSYISFMSLHNEGSREDEKYHQETSKLHNFH